MSLIRFPFTDAFGTYFITFRGYFQEKVQYIHLVFYTSANLM